MWFHLIIHTLLWPKTNFKSHTVITLWAMKPKKIQPENLLFILVTLVLVSVLIEELQEHTSHLFCHIQGKGALCKTKLKEKFTLFTQQKWRFDYNFFEEENIHIFSDFFFGLFLFRGFSAVWCLLELESLIILCTFAHESSRYLLTLVWWASLNY